MLHLKIGSSMREETLKSKDLCAHQMLFWLCDEISISARAWVMGGFYAIHYSSTLNFSIDYQYMR